MWSTPRRETGLLARKGIWWRWHRIELVVCFIEEECLALRCGAHQAPVLRSPVVHDPARGVLQVWLVVEEAQMRIVIRLVADEDDCPPGGKLPDRQQEIALVALRLAVAVANAGDRHRHEVRGEERQAERHAGDDRCRGTRTRGAC